ncbi:MAG: RNA polymerase sigma factor [Hamadaea sp.]|nr:RNA polymerase sigma factor [Hamadaea sp.]
MRAATTTGAGRQLIRTARPEPVGRTAVDGAAAETTADTAADAAADLHSEPWVLVERAQHGDRQAFGELYHRYHAEIFRYLWQRCGHVQLAQDMAGDVWERALRGIGNLHDHGVPPLAWLMTIARNRAIDHFRSGRFRYEVLCDTTRDARPPENPTDIEQLAVARIDAACVLEAVLSLSAAQRRTVLMTYFGGMRSPEVARRLGISEDAVKALNLRARRALAQRLAAHAHGGALS